MDLVFNFQQDDFIKLCINFIKNEKSTIFEDIYHSIVNLLSNSNNLIGKLIKVEHKYNTEFHDKHLSLLDYIEIGGIDYYYIYFEIYYPNNIELEINDIIMPKFLNLKKIEYGGGRSLKFEIQNNQTKKYNKFNIILKHLFIDSKLLKIIYQNSINIDNHQRLLPSKLGVWEWRQTFYNKINGDIYFCSCFKEALMKESNDNYNQLNIHIHKALKLTKFKENICHICSNENSDLFYCHPMYGSHFKVKYGAYIEKIRIEREIDEKAAENIVREIKGVPKIGEKWINETLLFNYICILFPNHKIEREASPDWLGNQRLDIFIQSLNLAIEYQGEQHFKNVSFFGGDNGFLKIKKLDIQKAIKCKENNINLIYFTYKENLSEKLVSSKLKQYLIQNQD